MPLYEYRCQTCGKLYEQIRRMAEADRDLECPECRSRDVERLVSSFATPAAGGGACSPGGKSRFT